MLYLISYDLRIGATPEDYERIASALRGAGAQRVLFSQWAVRSSSTAVQIRDLLKPLMDGNDRLLVTELSNWAAYNAMVDLNTL